MKKFLLLLAVVLPTFGAFAQVGLVKEGPDPEDDVEIQLDYRNPKIFEIAEINVIGAQFLDVNALISISGLKIGDKIIVDPNREEEEVMEARITIAIDQEQNICAIVEQAICKLLYNGPAVAMVP